MKQITKTEKVEKKLVKFVAEDGTEFENEKDCLNYERDCWRKELDNSGIETADVDYPNCDGGENYESHNYKWYRPKTHEEIELLRKAYELNEHDCRKQLSDELIGKWVCIETDCTDDFIWLTTIDDGIDYARTLLKNLGYEMTVTEVQNNG